MKNDQQGSEMELSRRTFLTGAAISAAGIAALGLTGCASGGTKTQATTAEKPKAADKVVETEVLVVGLGASGLQAAVGAAKLGAKVVAIDQASEMAGTTNILTTGFLCVGSSLQKKQPFSFEVQEVYDFLNNISNYTFNTQVLRAILGASGRAANNFIDAGLPLVTTELKERPVLTGPKAAQYSGHKYGVSGKERAVIFQKMLDDAKVECLYGTTAESLIIENGAHVGVRCKTASGITDIRAKKILLGTGGFLGSKEMVAKYFAGSEIVPMGNPANVGVGINLALSAGAQIGKNFSVSGNEYGGANPLATPTFSFRPGTGSNECMRLVLLGGIIVDSNGNRFINEEKVNKEAMHCGDPFIRAKKYYAIVDQDFVDYVAKTSLGDLMGDERMKTMFKGVIPTTLPDDIATAIKEGWTIKADTIADLAKGFNLTDLESTIKTYNEYCATGKDLDYFTPAEMLRKVSKPPFYAIQSLPAGWLSLGGIKTDASCHALDPDNKPIKNLFTIGCDADIYCTPYVAGGSGNGFALATGLIAGETAAKELGYKA